MAAGLAAAGVGPQDRVAFLDKNGIEHFEVFFGAALANAVCVDVNWRLAAPEVEFIVNDAQAKVFVVGPDFVPVLDAIADALTSVGDDPRHRRSRRRTRTTTRGSPSTSRPTRTRRADPTTSRSSSTRAARPAGRRA